MMRQDRFTQQARPVTLSSAKGLLGTRCFAEFILSEEKGSA